ncbi:proline-, glutamic acid- and leucine-rich protein 1-like, partial [Portunus trituberculatus]|uniref:proline-, glutamic acid- and leucine-rich protein 1-like n=1 Tax=Portunus trituberculatus TaxID=210409 RepID=UPI001E1CF25D
MDVYQNIWTNCEKSQLEKHNQLISECVINQGLFQNEDDRLLKIHVREINSLLNSPKTRERGLRLLLDVVPQCPQQVLAEQCERWFKFCSDAIAASRKTRSLTQACQVLTALLRDLPILPELQRCVSAKSSAFLVLELSSAVNDPAPLECLYEYIQAAPGQCLQHKKVLEERMLHHLDNPVTLCGGGSMTRLAGRVFAALPLPGIGGGNVAQARAEARGRQLALLLALAHSLMDTLLDGVVEKESHPYPREHSGLTLRPLEDITTDPISSRLAIIARLSNTLTFVAEMITDAANTAITFTADHLLSVAFRLLQVECGVLERYKGQEHKLLAFFLPSLHHQALLLLQDVITSLGEGTDCYFDTLGDLLTSVVQASKAGAKSRPVWCSGGQQTRVVAYAVLAELVRTSRGRHTPSAALVTMVLSDVSPKEEEVKLQKQGKGLASLSVTKAAGKKKGYTVTAGSAGANVGPVPRPDRFNRLARVALVVAEMLFAHASHSMALKDHQVCCWFVVTHYKIGRREMGTQRRWKSNSRRRKRKKKEDEEEPMIEDKINHTHEEERKEEDKEIEKDEGKKDKEREEENKNKKEDKNEDEIWCSEEEKDKNDLKEKKKENEKDKSDIEEEEEEENE